MALQVDDVQVEVGRAATEGNIDTVELWFAADYHIGRVPDGHGVSRSVEIKQRRVDGVHAIKF